MSLQPTSTSSTARAGRAAVAGGRRRSAWRSTPGQIVGLVGESGCGKSTLARVAVGLGAPSAGTVAFAGRPVDAAGLAAPVRAPRRLQMVFQDPYVSLNPRRRIGSQLLDGVPAAVHPGGPRRTGCTSCSNGWPCRPSAAQRYPHEFSGGQRQRIAIARALAADPA